VSVNGGTTPLSSWRRPRGAPAVGCALEMQSRWRATVASKLALLVTAGLGFALACGRPGPAGQARNESDTRPSTIVLEGIEDLVDRRCFLEAANLGAGLEQRLIAEHGRESLE